MSLHPDKRLETLTADLLKRWGRQVFRNLHGAPGEVVPHVPTGWAAMDRALGIGGIPRGCVTELLGAPTSGVSTLALSILASAQGEGDAAAYLDLARTFDADYAVRCGVDVANLLLIRPASVSEGLGIVQHVLEGSSLGALVVDLAFTPPGKLPEAAQVSRSLGALAGSRCALIFLMLLDSRSLEVTDAGLTSQTAVRLQVQKERWLKRRQDVSGYRARVTVTKNRFASPNRSVNLVFSGLDAKL